MHFLLFYEKAPGYEKREAPLQDEHRIHVLAALNSGEVVLAGSLADPVDGSAVLLFQSDSPAVAERFAATDPYVIHGVVSRWTVRTWATIVAAGDAPSLPTTTVQQV